MRCVVIPKLTNPSLYTHTEQVLKYSTYKPLTVNQVMLLHSYLLTPYLTGFPNNIF